MLSTTTTTITSDPGILCFHHCNVKVFCFTLPNICPNCHMELNTNSNGDAAGGGTDGGLMRPLVGKSLLPFRLPYPFVRASQYPCAIVLRPTTGDFLNDYNNATDLHIAVTTSNGCIVEFDRNGLQRRRADNMAEWWQSLLVGDVPEPWYDLWDSVLIQTCKQPSRWTIEQYHEDSHNCYTFVLTFLQALTYDKLSEAARSKTSFCEKYIVPRTTTAGKYISLYRKLRSNGIYVHPHHQKLHSKHQKQQKQQLSSHHHHQQQQQQHQLRQLKSIASSSSTLPIDSSSNNMSSSAAAVASSTSQPASSVVNSIMARAPTLCTIEE